MRLSTFSYYLSYSGTYTKNAVAEPVLRNVGLGHPQMVWETAWIPLLQSSSIDGWLSDTSFDRSILFLNICL